MLKNQYKINNNQIFFYFCNFFLHLYIDILSKLASILFSEHLAFANVSVTLQFQMDKFSQTYVP